MSQSQNNDKKDKAKAKTDGYKTGAVIGGVGGIALAIMLRRNILLGGLIGLIGGGYIGFEIEKAKRIKSTFKRQT